MPRILRTLMLASVAIALVGLTALWAGYRYLNRTPSELLRYTERRLYGHTRLETLFLPILYAIRRHEERPVDHLELPNLGKGSQARALPAVRYDTGGRPLEGTPAAATDISPIANLNPSTPEDISRAISGAKAGTVIEIAPGQYRIQTPLATRAAGTAGSPILVRAAKPGSVTIDIPFAEGFSVLHPYWVFENLTIRGVCKDEGSCEHAFHVVGKARATVIRNNRIEDFNAHIKVNGLGGDWPDHGLIQYNTLTNARRRDTLHPVTPVDIVGANDWRVADNLISNFVKGDSDRISYGVFMKGAGSDGRIERNLIVCTDHALSQPGIRVGLSFGGGGTDKSYCRDKRCDAEHSRGIAANNVIAHCNDFGIDVNLSNQITIAHNTLINTSGIDVRNAPASATVYGNLVDGRIRARNDAWIDAGSNLTGYLDDYLKAPDRLEISWLDGGKAVPTAANVDKDFCQRPRSSKSLPGALGEPEACARSSQP